MIVIQTKTLAPTDTKGARIKATIHSYVFRGGRKSVTIPWDHSLSHVKCHNSAAQAALDRFNDAMKGMIVFVPSAKDYPTLTVKDLSIGMADNGDCVYVLTANNAEI